MKHKRTILPALTAAMATAGIITYADHVEVAETLLVNVDATQQTAGTLNSITNSGTLGGFFEARGPEGTTPTIAQAGGTLGINLDGNDFLQLVDSLGGAFTAAPAGIIGVDPTRSIEVWAYNPFTINGEETMVAWGRRGGDGQNLSFGYGTHGAWGAAAQWGGQDIGWNNNGGAPQQNLWHHLVYTYDGTTTRVYADGVLANSETLGAGAINTDPSGIALGTQYNNEGTINEDPIRGSLLMAKVRVHDGVLTDAQIQHNYETERAQMIDPATPAPLALTSPPTHRYSFNVAASGTTEGTVIPDLIGVSDATIRGSGATLTGSRVALPGGGSATAPYVDLPNFLLSENSTNNFGTGEVTLEGWAKVTGNRSWARLVDFGLSGSDADVTGPGGGGNGLDYLFISAQVGGNTGLRKIEVKNDFPSDQPEFGAEFVTPTFNTDFHFVLTWNETTGEVLYYENGRLQSRMVVDDAMSDINDRNVWLGRSNWSGDQNLQGEYDEFRIYDRVLAPGEVSGNFQAGPNTINTGDLPALIVNDPSSITVQESFTANFTVGVEGSPPLSFQWLRNGTPIPNATNATYSFSATTDDNGAVFSAVVSNNTGTANVDTSGEATLTVESQAVTLRHHYDFSQTDTANQVMDSVGSAHGEARGGAVFSNGQLTLDGVDDYVNLPNGLVSTFNSVTLEMWVRNEGSAGWARLFDFGNSAAGEDFAPGAAGAAGTSYMFLAAPSGLGNLRGSITTNGGGAAEQVIEWTGQSIPNGQYTHIAFVINDPANAGRLFVNGNLVGQNLAVTLTPPMLGETLNNWLGRAQYNDPFWRGRFDSFSIHEGAMTPQQVQASFQSATNLVINEQPQSQQVNAGQLVTFSVGAEGVGLSYQWQFEGSDITDATNSTLTFAAQESHEGSYTVVVTGQFGSAESDAATLDVETVASPITITRQPRSQAVTEGRQAVLSVAVIGEWPFTYQWFRNDAPITQATNNFLVVTVTPDTIGDYHVVVSNSEGSAQSLDAAVSIVPDAYTGREGRYVGLFAENQANPETSGYIELTLQANGEFTMDIAIGRRSNQISHFFDTNGVTFVAAGGRVPVTIDLDVDGAGFEELEGTVTGNGWTAQLHLEKIATTIDPALQGQYKFALQAHADEATFPGGHSLATLNVDGSGVATVSGSLADGTRFQSESLLTINGAVPVYTPLYEKDGGTLVGWIQTDTNAPPSVDLTGNIDWVKMPATSGLYQAGFRYRAPVVGALYEAPESGRAIDVTTGIWLAEGGHIPGVIQSEFTLRNDNYVRFTSNTNGAKVKISADKGTFQGSFVHPVSGATVKFNGVLIQGQSQFGLGYFIDQDRAGAIFIGEFVGQ